MIKGHGQLTDPHTVDVDGKTYSAEYIIIGTGARDSSLPIPGAEYMHHSKDFLDLDEMPDFFIIRWGWGYQYGICIHGFSLRKEGHGY